MVIDLGLGWCFVICSGNRVKLQRLRIFKPWRKAGLVAGRPWRLHSSPGGTVHDSTPDRCRDGPQEFLKGFPGYLQCDAYPGYNRLFKAEAG